MAERQAATDGAAEHASVTDPFRSAQTLDAVPGPAAARPGTVKRQLAPETLRLYAGDWRHFHDYCAERGLTALPASPDLVATFLSAPGTGRAALARRLAAIDHQHRQRGLPPPGAAPGMRAVLRRARRAAPRRIRAAAPDAATLTRLAESCRGDLAGQRDRALLLLLAAGFGRAAIVALQAERLRFTETGLVLPPASGSDGMSQARHLPRSAALAACPVRALEDWLRVSLTRYGPVFRKVNRWGQLEHAALGVDAIRLILARRTAALSPGRKRR